MSVFFGIHATAGGKILDIDDTLLATHHFATPVHVDLFSTELDTHGFASSGTSSHRTDSHLLMNDTIIGYFLKRSHSIILPES